MSDTGQASVAQDEKWMWRALELAKEAQALGEVPIGAVLVIGGEPIAEGRNQPIAAHDPTAHAEIVALRAAAERLGNYRLPGTTLYVTLEPCCMCAGAIVQARVARVVYGAADPKSGADSLFQLLTTSKFNHRAEIRAGVLAGPCGQCLKDFFISRREQ